MKQLPHTHTHPLHPLYTPSPNMALALCRSGQFAYIAVLAISKGAPKFSCHKKLHCDLCVKAEAEATVTVISSASDRLQWAKHLQAITVMSCPQRAHQPCPLPCQRHKPCKHVCSLKCNGICKRRRERESISFETTRL